MKGNVGLWIDHREAVIVGIDESGKESVRRIRSNVERRTRMSGGSRSKSLYGPQDVASEQRRDHRYRGQLDNYYEAVVNEIKEAIAVRIFGPGEAKDELRKKIEGNKSLNGLLCGVEPADKMTDRQIVAKVRGLYRPARFLARV